MRTFYALALVAVAAASMVAATAMVHDDEIIDIINSGDYGWKAGRSARFEGWSLEDAQSLLGVARTSKSAFAVSRHSSFADAADVPAEFNAFATFNIKILVKNQEQCGSCWAFSATSALAYRFCIESKGANCPSLSPEDPVSCDYSNMGCNGGELPNVWSYMQHSGVVDSACFPYGSGNGVSPLCPSNSQCPGTGKWVKYHAKSYYHVTSANPVASMQQELLANGPVQVAFTVYSDFMQYKSGVYKHVTGSMLGGHAVTLVGWGTLNGTPFWAIQNSWGTSWGIDVTGAGSDKSGGFFYILRGADECGIEDDAFAGLAQLS